MALFGKVSDDYTKTGHGGLTKAANFLSGIPLIGSLTKLATKIPFIGNGISSLLGMVDTVWEAGKWAFQGKFGSAATVLVAGTASNAADALGVSWWMNDISQAVTGVTVRTHIRALAEGTIGVLGMHPDVLASYPAAIGSIGGTSIGGQDNFRDKIAAERGMTRAQMDARADQAYVNATQSQAGIGA